ncbi:hypothetical protein BN12_90018 [Nostocoides japonicum T1-X7]|uniref:Uncharacterized protein n=1 Tax=Nostocoides japonicum T1-X7 TaxID=1194083 RepID=A0A077M1Z1_9MICO|nr:hypothetical protein BN12_90018 [Tetrasphaera japonica T1-X7]
MRGPEPVAVPLLVATHPTHEDVSAWAIRSSSAAPGI